MKTNQAIVYTGMLATGLLIVAAVAAESGQFWLAGALGIVSLGLMVLNVAAFVASVHYRATTGRSIDQDLDAEENEEA